jgi:hypothetical protein
MVSMVRTIKTQRVHGSKVLVELEVHTSVGPFKFPMTVDDDGSAARIERAALEELAKFLEEALALVRRQLGSGQ